MSDETLVEHIARLVLEAHARSIGRAIVAACPPGTGFALVLTDLGDAGSMAYVGNCRREDMVKLLRELAAKIEAER